MLETCPMGAMMRELVGIARNGTVRRFEGGPYQLCDPDVLMVEAAEPSDRGNTTDGLHRSVKQSILVQRKMRAHLVAEPYVTRPTVLEAAMRLPL
jgi:hypothetical protein